MSREQNSVGAAQYYGPRQKEGLGAAISKYGVIEELVIPVNFAVPPTTSEVDQAIPVLPKGAFLEAALLETTTAFTGTGDVTVGLSEPDGTVIDADGIIAATAVAGLSEGSWTVGAGDLIGKAVSANAQVTVTIPGTVTGGEGRLIVRYVRPSVTPPRRAEPVAIPNG